jgi:hypothetical protein
MSKEDIILSNIKEIRTDVREIRLEQIKQGKDIARLKVRTSWIGGIAGIVGGTIAGIIAYIRVKIGGGNG